ncbi:glutathione S-transferase [Oleiphilus sp. HI0080]|nr:glutathione S-transferase [Oleiphilus sp. HI0080]
MKLNPAGRIPALVIDGQAMFESAAICVHLCELHPEHGLIPAVGTYARAEFFQWIMYLTNTLQAELMVRYYPERHIKDPTLVDGVIAAQDERIVEALEVINQRLEKQPYLCGDALTACDYFLFMLCEWSLVLTRSPVTFSALSAYLQKLSQNETIKTVCEIEGIDLSVFH